MKRTDQETRKITLLKAKSLLKEFEHSSHTINLMTHEYVGNFG